ncbi:MAG: type II toxin-antitoxin system death-on-curing family toxin [Rhizobiales bacterium]|nr:type II toxin-antitoxin system death-on-curing family toxin [Hyphomicrobiales bacterium]
MTEIKWLPKEAVLAMHARQLAEHGGGEGVRDIGLLESALQRPLNKAGYGSPDIAELAAAYAYGIARNHPFVDGNKRTALVASRTFLLTNGYQINASKEDRLKTFLALAEGSLSEDALAGWFRNHLVEV